jgi:hypothetical protein
MNIINLRFELTNPFDRWDYFKHLGCINGQLFRHKSWELEHSYYSPLLFDAELRLTHAKDHAGFDFGIGLFGYGINFRIYDTRHWDEYHKQWEEYGQTRY